MMASGGRKAPRRILTADEDELLTDLKTLTILNDRQRDESTSDLDVSYVIPEGGRRRPLMKISDYKIPKIEGLTPDPAPEIAPKRVAKGRSRLANKQKDGPLKLGLDAEFEMYRRVPCVDNNLQFFRNERFNLGAGHRYPFSPKSDEGRCDSNLSVRSKVKIPNFQQLDFAGFTNGQQALPSQPLHSPYFNGNSDFSVQANPSNTNGNDSPVFGQSAYHDGQFQDYDEVLSSNFENTCKVLPTTLNPTELSATEDVLEDVRLLPDTKEIPDNAKNSNGLDRRMDEMYMSDGESSTILMHQADSVQPSSVNTSYIFNSSSVSATLDTSHQCAQGSMAKPVDFASNKWDELTNNKVVELDWWNDPENETAQTKLRSSSILSFISACHNGQLDEEPFDLPPQSSDANNPHFSDSHDNHCNRESPDIEKAPQSRPVPTQENQYSSCSMKPNPSPCKKKIKLKSYNHAQESQPKDGKNLTLVNDSQRRPTLGWGDTSYRTIFGPNKTPHEPSKPNFLSTTSGVCRSVGVYGNAEHFTASRSVNAFMKQVRQPDPIFSMEDDFPALQPSCNINEKTSGYQNADDGWAKWSKDDTSSSSPVNDVPLEESKNLNNFDHHSIMIENLPPNSEKNLLEFLEPFGKILSISIFSTDTGHVAFVRLENDEHCEWLIDCFDGLIPAVGWSLPLKIKKLN